MGLPCLLSLASVTLPMQIARWTLMAATILFGGLVMLTSMGPGFLVAAVLTGVGLQDQLSSDTRPPITAEQNSRVHVARAHPAGQPGLVPRSPFAAVLGLPRQKVNYHLRLLEQHGLVELVEERPRRGLTERVVRATARAYVVAPPHVGRDAADPARTDRLSSRYLIALAARVVHEVATLTRRAEEAGRSLATLAIDTDIRFADAADRAAFTRELTEAVTAMAARYHDETHPAGRWHRLVVVAHARQ